MRGLAMVVACFGRAGLGQEEIVLEMIILSLFIHQPTDEVIIWPG